MSPIEIILLLVLAGYAIYRQTRQREVVAAGRFKLAIIYGVVGLAVGGFSHPNNGTEWLLLIVSLLLSVGVGLLRGRLTTVWKAGDHVYAQGTTLTISLFVGMVVAKFGLGTVAYFLKVSDDGGFGEVLVMIAVMVAFQAEIVWRRARPLGAQSARRPANV